MIIMTGIGKVIAARIEAEGKSVYRIVSVPYAKAGRFDRPEPIREVEAGRPINSDQTFCFPQRSIPKLFNLFLKHHMMRSEFLTEKDVQSENAFVVNIWTSDFDGKKPVLVYLHGGGDYGSGTSPIYDGAHLASKGIVVVTVTYRVGLLGYMPVYDEAGTLRCNRAAFDQQAALSWVRDKIGYFGGDAENITLMGQSGGALSALNQFLNPVSNRTFDKLILCAGPLPTAIPSEGTRETFEWLLRENGLRDYAALERLPMRKLPKLKAKNVMNDVIDGAFFAEDPNATLERGEFPRIPILVGANDDEFSMIELPMFYKGMRIETRTSRLDSALESRYGEFAPRLKTTIAPEADGPIDLQIRILELVVFHTVSFKLLERFSAARCPVYGYRFGYVPNLYNGLRGSYHGAEIAMFFGNLDKMKIRISERNRAEMAWVQRDWLAFIHDGAIPDRDRYDSSSRRIIRYEGEPAMIPFPHADLIQELAPSDVYRRAFSDFLKRR